MDFKRVRDVEEEPQPLFFSFSVRSEKLIQIEVGLSFFNPLSVKTDLKCKVAVFCISIFVPFCNLKL